MDLHAPFVVHVRYYWREQERFLQISANGNEAQNKTTSVFSCVCPVIDHEFRHNIVKVDCFDNVITKYIVNNRRDAGKTDVNLFFTITNCRIVRSRLLSHRINFKFMCLSAY